MGILRNASPYKVLEKACSRDSTSSTEWPRITTTTTAFGTRIGSGMLQCPVHLGRASRMLTCVCRAAVALHVHRSGRPLGKPPADRDTICPCLAAIQAAMAAWLLRCKCRMTTKHTGTGRGPGHRLPLPALICKQLPSQEHGPSPVFHGRRASPAQGWWLQGRPLPRAPPPRLLAQHEFAGPRSAIHLIKLAARAWPLN